jgi:hypothetical protein
MHSVCCVGRRRRDGVGLVPDERTPRCDKRANQATDRSDESVLDVTLQMV